jgi:chromosome segregation protein
VHLRKLEMRGFKTFADKTEMSFGPGITAIVGPNGVGKSNVTDALLWALGEQSPRTLRTESLQDVIFAGSEKRRPLNMAEVNVTLDNSDHSLPLDFSEVVISRRVFRDGETTYLINNSPCRLRDVRELLLDSGVGPKAYSVVGQGEIDAILSIRGEDRRELLEEVAGVRKYRVRRSEAERKLEATQVNLTRVTDIVHELRGQREPLEKQAQAARIYKELDEKLRQLELHLLTADYRRHAQRRGQLANEVAVARADQQTSRNCLSQVDAEYQKLAGTIAKLEGELEQLRLEALRLQRAVAHEREQRAVNQERLRALQAQAESLQSTEQGRQQRHRVLGQQHEALQSEQKALATRLANEEQQLNQLRQEFETRRQAVQKQEQRAATLEGQRVKLLQEVARLENEAAAMSSLQTDLQERIARLDSQRTQLAERLEGMEQAGTSGAEKSDELRQQVQAAREKVQELEAHVAHVQQVIREQNTKRSLLSEAVSRLESRQRVLSELKESYEGYAEGTRQVMAAAAARQLNGIRGVVGELLDVPEKLETAIEAALGERLQWIVVNTQEDALQAIEFLRRENLGRAAFLPLSALPRRTSETINTANLKGGYLGMATKLIRLNRQCAPALEQVIGNLALCTDRESALETFRRAANRMSVVTLEGEVLEPAGLVRGGVVEGGASQGFSRQRELEALEGRIEQLHQAVGRMVVVDEQLEAEHSRSRSEARLAEERLVELQSDLRQNEGEVRHLQDQRQAAMEAAAETENETARLRGRLDQAARRQGEAAERCDQLRQQQGSMQTEIEQAREAAGSGANLEGLQTDLTARQVAVAEVREKLAANRRTTEQAQRDLKAVTESLAHTRRQRQETEQEIENLKATLSRATAEAEDVARGQKLEKQAEEQAETLARLRERSAEADVNRRELTRALQTQTERLHAADLTLTRSEAQLQGIGERLQDMYEMTVEEALQVELEGMSENTARREAGQLRGEMRRLGSVNLSSIEECERLQAREDFLQGQQDDLLAAKDDLLTVIQEMDEAAKEVFLQTFGEVTVEFDRIFRLLFDGGTTELQLTDPDDPLNSGVEVIVTPPGKRQQNLLMLSGGERAMTALALLFALLQVKPSPFCVMDEIDAALDAANTDRFGEMLQDFARRSQFIIITHNPRTMEKVDTLHGITMQDPGTSRLISVELEEAQRLAKEQQAPAPA